MATTIAAAAAVASSFVFLPLKHKNSAYFSNNSEIVVANCPAETASLTLGCDLVQSLVFYPSAKKWSVMESLAIHGMSQCLRGSSSGFVVLFGTVLLFLEYFDPH